MDKYAKSVRKKINDALRALEESMGSVEQTTHATLLRADEHLWSVTETIKQAYVSPTPYRVSEMCQLIKQHLKAAKD